MKRRRNEDRTSRRQTRKRVLGMEILCDRVVLDGSGLGVSDPLPWFEPGALTYSFAPDGTHVASEQSSLFAQLGTLGETTNWQEQFASAFNSWLAPLNASSSQVADSGDPFGIAGRTQGDLRFGDIRIAAIPLSTDVLATSIPHSAMVQGTWAGDILINADAQWNDLQEVFAVALHEFGHVLGLQHSADPASSMFSHGVRELYAPTGADIENLLDVYLGIDFENGDDTPDHESDSSDPAQSSVTVALEDAITLNPAIGSTIRYVASAFVVDSVAPVIYRLDPTASEAEDLENLHVALQSSGTNRMLTDITVVDSLGQTVESVELHHGQGSVIVQALGVDSRKTHYVIVTPTSLGAQGGQFEIVMEYTRELQLARKTGDILFDAEHPALEQSFSVKSSRLVHLHLEIPKTSSFPSSVQAWLLDQDRRVLTLVTLSPGTARSAPLTFLAAGEYKLYFVADSLTETFVDAIQINVVINEVSIDIGPGINDPTDTPLLPCDEPDADPDYCFIYEPIDPDPPDDPDSNVFNDPNNPWWTDQGYTCSDYAPEEFGGIPEFDPVWWQFNIEACQGIAVPPIDPPPSSWQNPSNRYDVSGNADVTALDALIVINTLSRTLNGQLSLSNQTNESFVDVNGDFRVTPVDALMVINYIAVQRSSAEGESVVQLPVASSVDWHAAAVRNTDVAYLIATDRWFSGLGINLY